jgi:lipid-binding SYLF domain-containing protein
MKHSTIGIVVAGLILGATLTARAESDRELIADAQATVAKFQKADPGMTRFFERAAGYAVFPDAGKGGLGIGGAHGTGVLFIKGQPVGKTTMTQVTIGAQAGGQAFAEVIFFETVATVTNFQKGEFKFSGSVSAVALKSGASAAAKYTDGVAVFTATKGGLMLEAAVGGQKFSYEPFMTVKK